MQQAELYHLLKQKYGFDEFRPGQLAVIQHLLAGEDVLAVLPTGTGKSLIYQLVGSVLPGLVVVVSPLISLMQDQVARLNYQGEKRVAALTSQQNYGSRQQLLNRLDQLDFLFVSPEMLNQSAVLTAVHRVQLALFVVDEAHCISTWGPDFRPDYLTLGTLRNQLGDPVTLMLTATATARVRDDITRQLRVPTAHQVLYSVNRPNIYLAVATLSDETAKRARLRQLIETVAGPVVVYFSSKRQTDLTADWLRDVTGLRVAGYHAGLSAEDRFKIQQQFMTGQLDVICATSAFGMGINKADIRMVIHYHLPTSLADYVQEIGRAGRDGQPALAMILYVAGDEHLVQSLNDLTSATPAEIAADQQRFARKQPAQDALSEVLDHYWQRGIDPERVSEQFTARAAAKQRELAALLRYVTSTTCRRAVMLSYFGEDAPEHSLTCCQLPGADLPLDQLGLKRGAAPITSEVEDWEIQLKRLFLLNF